MAKTTARTIRVNDELWAEASAWADALGTSVSELLRHALRRSVGDYTGVNYKDSFAMNIFDGALVLSRDWSSADPQRHRFHMAGCDVTVKGIDLVISPQKNAPVMRDGQGDTSLSIVGNTFHRPANSEFVIDLP